MGGSSNADSGGGGVGGIDSGGGGGATDRPDDKDSGLSGSDKDDFDRAMDNAERPDRAAAASADTTSRSDDDDDQRDTDRPDDRAMDNSERPDRASAAAADTTSPTDDDDDQRDTDRPNDRAMDNSERPDRAAAPSPSSPAPADTAADPNDGDDDRDDRGFLDRVADTLSTPPTDAEGRARSSSPVADRVRNHTQNYTVDDVKNIFAADEPPVTPEQSKALEEGAAVMEEVTIVPTTDAKPANSAPLSPLQASAALADAEFSVSMQVYERETTARIDEIDNRIDAINRQLDQDVVQDASNGLHLGAERARLTVERQELEETLASPESVERALRDGDDKIGLSPDVLEKVVTGRNELAKKIDAKREELNTAPANHPDTLVLRDDLLGLQDDYRNMTDLGIAYQDLVDQERKLNDGETIYVDKETSRIVEELAAKALAFTVAPPSLAPLQVLGRTSRAAQTDLIPEGEITIQRREDGVYEVMVPENRSPYDAWASEISFYEIEEDGTVTRTGSILDGGTAPRVVDSNLKERVDDLDLSSLTNGMIVFNEGSIKVAPEIREQVELIMSGDAQKRP